MKRILFISVLITVTLSLSAQIKYKDGRLLIGAVEPVSYYTATIAGGGVYFKHSNNRFLQIDVASYGAPRIAGHNDQIVFYNTATSTFNSIQVSNVYNYSDARAKRNIKSFSNGLDVISKLKPVSYNFIGQTNRSAEYNNYTGSNTEIGLLAQDIEKVLPNIVFTDKEGRKLVNYSALIPVLIDAVKSLQKEVEELKRTKN